jgi:hypothetical protein
MSCASCSSSISSSRGPTRTAVADWLRRHPELSSAQAKRLSYELIHQPLTEDKLAGVLILSE